MKLVILLVFIMNIISIFAYQLDLISENDSEIIAHFSLNEFDIQTQNFSTETFSQIIVPNATYPAQIGEPNIPYIARSLILTKTEKSKILISDMRSYEIDIPTIFPSQGTEKNSIPSEFKEPKLSKTYQADEWLLAEVASLGENYTLRDFKGCVLTIYPFAYQPAENKLRVAESFTITIQKEKNSAFPARIVKSFSEIYSHHFLNYNFLLNRYTPIMDVGNLVIISPQNYTDAMLPFIEWKNRKGIPASLFSYPLETGASSSSLRSFLQNLYNENSLAFILLVGDADDIPPATGYSGWANGSEADPVYTLLDGDDEYPDAFIGRFSANTSQEMEVIVSKNLQYEMFPDGEADWYHKALGIASNEAFPPYPVDWLLMNGVNETLLAYSYSEVAEVYDPGATSQQVTSAVNEGRSWINYLGHGGANGWNTSSFNIADVNTLQNTDKLPVIVSVACSVGDFAETTCFAEAWQRLGTISEPKGSIAFMGSSVGQGTAAWEGMDEMIQLLIEDTYFSIAGLFFNGEMRAIDEHPGIGVGTGSECFQSWHLFGDPTLTYFTDTPQSMHVQHLAELNNGSVEVSILVKTNQSLGIPIQDALVCIYREGAMYATGFTDNDGLLELSFDEELQFNQSYELNVTAYNKLPFMGFIENFTDSEPAIIDPKMYCNAYPNPFNPSVTISVELGKKIAESNVEIHIYNAKGQKINSLTAIPNSDSSSKGCAIWNGTDLHGKRVASGVYFYRVVLDKLVWSKKVLLIK